MMTTTMKTTFNLKPLMKAISMPQTSTDEAHKRRDKILAEAAKLLRWSDQYKVSKVLGADEKKRRSEQARRNFERYDPSPPLGMNFLYSNLPNGKSR
jgi:hypothetical protein